MLWLKIRPQGGTKELSLRFDARDADERGFGSWRVCDADRFPARTIVDVSSCSVFRRIWFCSIRSLLGGYKCIFQYALAYRKILNPFLSFFFLFQSMKEPLANPTTKTSKNRVDAHSLNLKLPSCTGKCVLSVLLARWLQFSPTNPDKQEHDVWS